MHRACSRAPVRTVMRHSPPPSPLLSTLGVPVTSCFSGRKEPGSRVGPPQELTPDGRARPPFGILKENPAQGINTETCQRPVRKPPGGGAAARA